MKFLLTIFAFYILLLPCLFCSDTDDSNNAFKTDLKHASSQKDNQQHTETCNPFCSCACCGHIFTPNFQLNNLAVAKTITKQQQQFFYNNISLSSDYFGNIWQPPKTS